MSEDQEIIKNVRPNRDIEFLFGEYRYFFRLLGIEKNHSFFFIFFIPNFVALEIIETPRRNVDEFWLK